MNPGLTPYVPLNRKSPSDSVPFTVNEYGITNLNFNSKSGSPSKNSSILTLKELTPESTDGSSIFNSSHDLRSVGGTQSTLFQKFTGFVSKHKVLSSVAMAFFGLVALGLLASGIGAIIAGGVVSITVTTWAVGLAIKSLSLLATILSSVGFFVGSALFGYATYKTGQALY